MLTSHCLVCNHHCLTQQSCCANPAELIQDNPFDGLATGCDWARNSSGRHLDFACFHMWPDNWLKARAAPHQIPHLKRLGPQTVDASCLSVSVQAGRSCTHPSADKPGSPKMQPGLPRIHACHAHIPFRYRARMRRRNCASRGAGSTATWTRRRPSASHWCWASSARPAAAPHAPSSTARWAG